MRRTEYEQAVLTELRAQLNPDRLVWAGGAGIPARQVKLLEVDNLWERIQVEEIELDTSGPEHTIVILLRDLSRPQCLFGRWVEAMETFTDDDSSLTDPDFYATIICANLTEDILATNHGLPRDCSPDGINWF